MSFARWVPLVGLFAVLSFVPGVLAHHCAGGGEAAGGQFSTQALAAAPSPLAIAAYVLIPIVGVLLALGIAIPSMRKTEPVKGSWQLTGTGYVWVPAKK